MACTYSWSWCEFPFQGSSLLLNEVSSHTGSDSQASTPVSKPSSAYPSTTIVNPTIVLLQHNRGEGLWPSSPSPETSTQLSACARQCPYISSWASCPFNSFIGPAELPVGRERIPALGQCLSKQAGPVYVPGFGCSWLSCLDADIRKEGKKSKQARET